MTEIKRVILFIALSVILVISSVFAIYFIGWESEHSYVYAEALSETEVSANSDYNIGDIYSDGEINGKDAIYLQQYLAQMVDFDDTSLVNANTYVEDNGYDGSIKVNGRDAIILLQYLAKMDVSMGVGEWSVQIAPTVSGSGTIVRNVAYGIETAELPALNTTDYTCTLKTQATCSSYAVYTYTCSKDGSTFSFDVKGDTYGDHVSSDWTVAQAATCEEDGYKHIVCTVCGTELERETIAAFGHVYGGWTVVQTATCEEDGYKHKVCTVCGVELETETIVATGHSYGEWVVSVDPTFISTGTLVKTCVNDPSHKITVSIPALNKTEYVYSIISEATCATEGEITYSYNKDGQYFVFVVNTEKLPHTEVIDAAVAATCTESGLTEGSHCSVCGEVITAQTVVPSLGHTFVVTQAAVSPTCTATGLTEEKTCSVCGYKIEQTVVEATGHSDSNHDYVCDTCGEKTADIYTVSLESFSGSVSKNSSTVIYGDSFTLPVPTLKGYTFVGWFTNTGSSGVQVTDENGNGLSGLSGLTSTRLYAIYTPKVFTVTFDSNGGTSVASQKYSYGTTFNPDSAVSTYSSYQFSGWYTADGVKYTSTTLIEDDVTLYAQWVYSIAVSTAADLIAIADDPTANYHLTGNINLKGEVWTPISEFSGTLLGNGYKIYNFILQTTSDSTFAFILTNNGTIDGLTLYDFTYNVSITSGSNNLGILVAKNNGTISNCDITSGLLNITLNVSYGGVITYYFYFGYFAGLNYGEISNCSNIVDITMSLTINETKNNALDGTIDMYYYFGGIAGYNEGTIYGCNNTCTMDINRYSYGNYAWDVHYAYDYCDAGGIVGGNKGTITQCAADVVITGSSNVNIYGYEYIRVGGLVGLNSATIESCTATGTLNNGSVNSPYMGGLVGLNEANATIKSCYSTTVINHTLGSGSIGGFVGYNKGIIQNSYATGDVTSSVAGYVAGFVGTNTSSGSISKCYASGNVNAADTSAGYFAASSSGTMFKCYYLSGSYLVINGVYYNHATEFDTVSGEVYYTLWSTEFLIDELYWEEESWIVVVNGDPMLEWEMYINHDYTITVIEATCEGVGCTLYVCNDCGLFFMRDYVEAYGHTYDEGTVTHEPTCTEVGYKLYTCQTCGGIYIETLDALGHTWELYEAHDATCTHDAYNDYVCIVCGETMTETLEGTATGHSQLIITAAEDPTGYLDNGNYVFVNGYTAEIVCTAENCDCYDASATYGEVGYKYSNSGYVIIQAREQTVEHTWQLEETITEATCTESGRGLFVSIYTGQSAYLDIDATGHTDADMNYICDVCSVYIGFESDATVTEISTVEGLLAISDNLNGIYMLTANINLSGYTWEGIGSESAPFTGYFNGNGYTISNLVLKDCEYGGLFGYNKGVIYNVTIKNATVTVTNTNSVIGLIAAYNGGAIVGCTVTGTVKVEINMTETMSSFVDSAYVYASAFGCIAGENQVTGSINDCTVNATTTINVTNTINIALGWNLGSLINTLSNKYYKKSITSTLTFVMGFISGRNSGSIIGCTVDIASAGEIILACEFVHSGNGKICTANAYMNLYCGVYTGVDYGTCSDCKLLSYDFTINEGKVPKNDGSNDYWQHNSTIIYY